MYFSIIIPVYNRPDETDELLESLTKLDYSQPFEVVIIEDGSTHKSEKVIEKYNNQLQISYYFKPNSGPGDSRNYGMNVAKGEYFIIFDSDCIIPVNYLKTVATELEKEYVDCFGGSDLAHESFTDIQKAINFSMTSFLTTGGIRGGSEKVTKFQPRSFNMGISKKAFLDSKGFGNIHPGEDPDLSIRLWKLGYQTRLIAHASVFHKRRIDWKKFYTQVNKFGKARPILDNWYPEFSKLTFWFPSLFLIGFIFSVLLLFLSFNGLVYLYGLYFLLIFCVATFHNKSLKIGLYSIVAVCIQFYGYGTGFLKSFFKIRIAQQNPETALPEMFFKKRI